MIWYFVGKPITEMLSPSGHPHPCCWQGLYQQHTWRVWPCTASVWHILANQTDFPPFFCEGGRKLQIVLRTKEYNSPSRIASSVAWHGSSFLVQLPVYPAGELQHELVQLLALDPLWYHLQFVAAKQNPCAQRIVSTETT